MKAPSVNCKTKKRDKDKDTGVYLCKSSRLCKATRPREGAGGLNHNVGLEDEDVPRVLVPAQKLSCKGRD